MSGTVLRLKGVRHYDGPACLAAGRLRVGASLKLVAEPRNPHDSNAVVVLLASTEAKLGYLSKEIAPKYRDALVANRVTSARIAKVTKGRGDRQNLQIQISIGMTSSVEPTQNKPCAEMPAELSSIVTGLPAEGGVYEIRNTRNDRRYIGSSASMRRRVRQHFLDAALNKHPNPWFEKDFVAQEGVDFTARILAKIDTSSRRLIEEEAWVKRALQEGLSLYNMTSDGQGRYGRKKPLEDAPQSRIGFGSAAARAAGALEIRSLARGTSAILDRRRSHLQDRRRRAKKQAGRPSRPRLSTREQSLPSDCEG